MSLLPKAVHDLMREIAPVPYSKLMFAYRGNQGREYTDVLNVASLDRRRMIAKILDEVKIAHFKASAAHLHRELLAPIAVMLGEGRCLDSCVVEAGGYMGSSPAKLS